MTTDRADAVAETRRFNRFYTRVAGFLDEKLTHSRFTLTEARVVFELAHRDAPVASEIARDLGLDPAYLARLLKKFAAAGLVERSRSDVDGRRRDLLLTPSGRAAFDELQARADAEMGALLEPVPAHDLPGLGRAMRAIARILGPHAAPAVALRAHRPGDVGWVISRQGALYAGEYGWDITFEALVAEIGAAFIRNFDADREGCWIAELDGERAGAVFLVRDGDGTARLRLLHVEAWARGHGLGTMLVDACIAKARAAGYRRLVLWTNDVLVSARRIYQAAGFRLVGEERHRSFGKDLVGQDWELDL